MSSLQSYINTVGLKANKAGEAIVSADSEKKNSALLAIANSLDLNRSALKEANEKDLQNATANNVSAALIDRLQFDDKIIDATITSLHEITALADPIGEINDVKPRPSGISVGTMRVPLGVIAIIYESRPNVTVDAAALCLKAGNTCILRGGSEALNSNKTIGRCIQSGLLEAKLPAEVVQVINVTDREVVAQMLRSPHIDLMIPRGGKELVQRVSEEAIMPVIKHLDGVCHVYIHANADIEKAINIAMNSKTHRYGVCNAMETLLVDAKIAPDVLEQLAKLYREKSVTLKGCEKTKKIIKNIEDATEADWFTEYLAPILSIRVVNDIDEAITHINHYGSHHTDSIVSEDYSVIKRFLKEIDSASVIVNASTRFGDGFEYGLGAEIGISTDKFHARGPVGLYGLTSQKYVVFGDGQIR